MNSKFVLNLDENLLKEAQAVAVKNNYTLPQLIEAYLLFLTNHKNDLMMKPSVLSEISGILKARKTSEELVEEYKDHIVHKHT